MTIGSNDINKAISILLEKGVLFGDNSCPGLYLELSPSRKDLLNNLKDYFKEINYDIICQSLSIPNKMTFHYYLYLTPKLYDLHPKYGFYQDIIKKLASIHYNVPESQISFDFL